MSGDLAARIARIIEAIEAGYAELERRAVEEAGR